VCDVVIGRFNVCPREPESYGDVAQESEVVLRAEEDPVRKINSRMTAIGAELDLAMTRSGTAQAEECVCLGAVFRGTLARAKAD